MNGDRRANFIKRKYTNGSLCMHDFLKEFSTGIYPRKQGSNWDEQDKMLLLDSINMGYPIGNILVWDTDEETSLWSSTGKGAYIIDGYERVLTITEAAFDTSRAIWYDPRYGSFDYYSNDNEDRHFPIHKLWDTFEYLSEIERIRSCEDGELYVSNIREMFRRFISFTISILRFKGIGLEEATRVSIRANK